MSRARVVLASGLVIGLATLACLGAAVAGEPSAREIMQKNFFAARVKALRSESTMVLVNEKGQTRERKNISLVQLQKNGVDSNLLVRFTAPADIRGTSFLQLEHIDGEDDQWMYLPALKKSRRLVANNKKDSFVGSDFSYGDVALPKVDLYRHVLLRSEGVDGHDCYVIESRPQNEAVRSDSGYSKKIVWVRKDSFVESKVEYYDLSGRLLKTQTIADQKEIEPDTHRWFALHREMVNHQTNHRTILTFDKIESAASIPDDAFTTRSIERN